MPWRLPLGGTHPPKVLVPGVQSSGRLQNPRIKERTLTGRLRNPRIKEITLNDAKDPSGTYPPGTSGFLRSRKDERFRTLLSWASCQGI